MQAPPERREFGPVDPAPESDASQAVGPYLRAIRRHLRFVIAVTLLAVAIAAVSVLRGGRTYQASAAVLVSPIPQADASYTAFVGLGVVLDTGDPARTLQTALALINTDQSAAATAPAMGPGWTAQRVQKAVTVTPLGQSNVLSVTASGSSASEAANLANRYAQAAAALRGSIVQHNISQQLAGLEARAATLPPSAPGTSSQLADLSIRIAELRAAKAHGGDPTLSVSQSAVAPTSPVGASRVLILLLSLIGGFALASVAALGLEFFSRPVRDEEELSAVFPLPVLASIPRIRHPGDAPLSPWLLSPPVFEQVRMLRVQLELSASGDSSVIMVTSASSGDGKTTLAAALAAAFSESGRDVILMDLDLRKPSLARVLSLETPRNAITTTLPVPSLPRVKLLRLPTSNASSLDALMDGLPAILAEARRAARFVIVDTAPVGEVSETLRIAPMCDSIVFAARLRHTDRRRLATARDLLSRAGSVPAGVVVVGGPGGVSDGSYYSYANIGVHWSPFGNGAANGTAPPSGRLIDRITRGRRSRA
ncbi:MAG TPA: P-loop NTPase [Solirubrobacteraceae bacterium]|nr:P-loop NTPase [Solirubrobacteraceae bacterium]